MPRRAGPADPARSPGARTQVRRRTRPRRRRRGESALTWCLLLVGAGLVAEEDTAKLALFPQRRSMLAAATSRRAREGSPIGASARPREARRPPRPALPRRVGPRRLARGCGGSRPGDLQPGPRATALPPPRRRPRVPAARAPQHVPEHEANRGPAPTNRASPGGSRLRRGALVDPPRRRTRGAGGIRDGGGPPGGLPRRRRRGRRRRPLLCRGGDGAADSAGDGDEPPLPRTAAGRARPGLEADVPWLFRAAAGPPRGPRLDAVRRSMRVRVSERVERLLAVARRELERLARADVFDDDPQAIRGPVPEEDDLEPVAGTTVELRRAIGVVVVGRVAHGVPSARGRCVLQGTPPAAPYSRPHAAAVVAASRALRRTELPTEARLVVRETGAATRPPPP